MKIDNFKKKSVGWGKRWRYYADFSFGGRPDLNKTIWFEVEKKYCDNGFFPTESFLVAAYPMALELEEELFFDSTVDEKLKRNLSKVNYYLGYPYLSKIFELRGGVGKVGRGKGRGLFFSLGIDSFHSLLNLEGKISHLIYVEGFDVKLKGRLFLGRIHRMIRGVGRRLKKEGVFVRTNLRWDLSEKVVPWIYYHGAALAAGGYVVQECGRFYISSSDQYATYIPWGTGSTVDRLWSSEEVKFVPSDVSLNRVKKIRDIVRWKRSWGLIDKYLRVCWQGFGMGWQLNCGKCEKCIRTYMQMKLAGYGGKLATLSKVSVAGARHLEIHGYEVIVWQRIKEMIENNRRGLFREELGVITEMVERAKRDVSDEKGRRLY